MCGCLLCTLHWGTWWATQTFVLTGNQTGDPLVHRLTLNPLSYTSQGVAVNLTLSTLILKDGEQVDFCRELRRGTRIMCSGEQGEQCSNEMAGAKDRTEHREEGMSHKEVAVDQVSKPRGRCRTSVCWRHIIVMSPCDAGKMGVFKNMVEDSNSKPLQTKTMKSYKKTLRKEKNLLVYSFFFNLHLIFPQEKPSFPSLCIIRMKKYQQHPSLFKLEIFFFLGNTWACVVLTFSCHLNFLNKSSLFQLAILKASLESFFLWRKIKGC